MLTTAQISSGIKSNVCLAIIKQIDKHHGAIMQMLPISNSFRMQLLKYLPSAFAITYQKVIYTGKYASDADRHGQMTCIYSE